MKKAVVALFAVIVVVMVFWWWQRPPTATLATGSLTGMLANEDMAGYALALEPGTIQFPRDFGPHDDYYTEWWYYTGNLETSEGRVFGYQLTFFRSTMAPPGKTPAAADPSPWRANQSYMAHFAISDVADKAFYPSEKFARKALGLAGATAQPYSVWLENWSARETDDNDVRLFAETEDATLDIELSQTLPPVLHGDAGLSVKGSEPGDASYYYSLVRQQTRGTVTVDGQTFTVTGLSWTDHEYGTSALSGDDVGWDWLSAQLDDGTCLMFFQIRQADGSLKPFSSGSFIAADGTVTHLDLSDWHMQVTDRWTSDQSGAAYPIGWDIEIKRIGLNLTGSAMMPDQELPLSTTYWEGAVTFDGDYLGKPVSGRGYVEMTGYMPQNS